MGGQHPLLHGKGSINIVLRRRWATRQTCHGLRAWMACSFTALPLGSQQSARRAEPRISGLAYVERWLLHWPRRAEDSSPLGYAGLLAAQAPDLECSVSVGHAPRSKYTHHLVEIGDFLASGNIHGHFHPGMDNVPVHC